MPQSGLREGCSDNASPFPRSFSWLCQLLLVAARSLKPLHAAAENLQRSECPALELNDDDVVLREKYRTVNRHIQFVDEANRWIEQQILTVYREDCCAGEVLAKLPPALEMVIRPAPSCELIKQDLEVVERTLGRTLGTTYLAARRLWANVWMTSHKSVSEAADIDRRTGAVIIAMCAAVEYVELHLIPAKWFRTMLTKELAQRAEHERALPLACEAPLPNRLEVQKGRHRDAKRRPAGDIPKRSWTQPELDEEIRQFKTRRANHYHGLVRRVKAGNQGAKKAAQEMYGRNAIARALGVRSPAMVTKSPTWQKMADELDLRRGRKRNAVKKPRERIGMDIALEEQAVASGNATEQDVIRRETESLIRKAMPEREGDDVIDKLQRGEMSDDDARELINLYGAQQQDDHARRIMPEF